MPHISIFLTILLAAAVPVDDKAKPDEQAKKVAEQFCKAVKAEDVDAVMKLVDVPWFHDGKKVIRKREELKQEFTDVFQKKDLTRLTLEIANVHRYGDVENEANENERELLKGVLGPDDRIVVIQVSVNGKQGDKIMLGVRLRKGEAKIVGLRD